MTVGCLRKNPKREAEAMRRQVKTKFLAQLLLTLVVLGVGVHFLHAFQVKRNAKAFLLRADEAEADKEFDKSLDYLRRYLGFHPNDTEAQVRYALLLDKQATTPQARLRAFFALEQAHRADPSREDVRRRIIATAMAVGRFADAKDHLSALLETYRDDVELKESSPNVKKRVASRIGPSSCTRKSSSKPPIASPVTSGWRGCISGSTRTSRRTR